MEYFCEAYCSENRIGLFRNRLGWASSIDIRKKLHALAVIRSYKNIVLDFSNITNVYPNGIVPIIAEVNRLKQNGIAFSVIPPSNEDVKSLFIRSGWFHYIQPEVYELPKLESSRSFALQKFSSDEELNDIVNRAVEICLQQLVFADGIPQAFEWALNEIAGNILVHSGADIGWIQVVTYRENHRLALIVCDSGIGIPGSMKKAFDFSNDQQALEMAMRKGVTSNPKNGQGNGLAGALAIAQHSDGILAITSGKGRVRVSEGRVEPKLHLPPYRGTCVEMQFSTEKPIDLPKALWGHEPTSYIENKFEDEMGVMIFNLREYATSFGNRITGERLRNLVLNLIKQNPGHPVRIGMDEIGIISSSFADELFGKLIVELGTIDFSRLIKLDKINPVCKSIVDVAIGQRFAQTYLMHDNGGKKYSG
jgi:anti-sigma regulatory factor (Ser/Thr protein kinase)/anti-anti-sigma regulatory factor